MLDSTVLVISPIGLPPYSCRGITDTIEPIAASAQIQRTVNGGLVNLSPAQFQKYRLTLSCSDVDPPAFDGVWPGAILTVDCISELAYLTSGGSPSRPTVDGSERTEGEFSWYRPRLIVMMTTPWQIQTDEWGATVGWNAEAEEV
jgi:hypothetical protein